MAIDLASLLQKATPLPAGTKVGGSQTGFDFNPDLANTIAQGNAAHGATGAQNVQDLLADPTKNSAYQTTLAGILASLQGDRSAQRQALADQFKAAGAEQSGAMGTAFANLEGQFANADAVAAGEAMKSFLPSAVQGYGDLAKLGGPSLLEALKTGQSFDLANSGDPNASKSGGMSYMPDYHAGIGPGSSPLGIPTGPMMGTGNASGSFGGPTAKKSGGTFF